MADGENRAGKIFERVLKHLAAVHIEMVCRLVQQKNVVLAQHQLRQRDTPLLAAGKRGNGHEHIITREEE